MRRLFFGSSLIGYALKYNHRHRRHGQLFQNRYKSILCREDAWLREWVRYVHLNPLRAGLINDLEALKQYPYAGHSAFKRRGSAEGRRAEVQVEVSRL